VGCLVHVIWEIGNLAKIGDRCEVVGFRQRDVGL
jgi:hypothetical protein